MRTNDLQVPQMALKPYYQDSAVTIYHGDCRAIVPALPRADLLLTDPPYGLGIASKNLGQGRTTGIASTPMVYGEWDTKLPDYLTLWLLHMAREQIIWGGNYYANLLPASQCWLTWDKRGERQPERSFADCELAWTSFDKAARRLILPWDGFVIPAAETRNGHPTQKPVRLMAWCIEVASVPEPPQVILDPFMGSGTTLRAAKDLGRKAIGIEIEERYCEIAAKRMEQEVMDFGASAICPPTVAEQTPALFPKESSL